MDWRDQGILLSSRRHGETSAIIEVFTETHGRHLGVVRGGASRKMSGVLQPGTQLDVAWRARLEDHLGAFTVEPIKTRAGAVMGDRLALAGFTSVLALASWALPEREMMGDFYAQTHDLVDAMAEGQGWLPLLPQWELDLLERLGFGLDLSTCAVSGGANDLAYVSPRTGRAVSRSGAGEWANRLLPLPEILLGGTANGAGVRDALTTTGHFLTTRLAPHLGDRPVPEARQRFLDQLDRHL